jgi:hypothetical protein
MSLGPADPARFDDKSCIRAGADGVLGRRARKARPSRLCSISKTMTETTDPNLAARQREALISLTALYYIEEHSLLDTAQLTDAKESLQALFLRTSGAETMLRRLIEVLKVKRNMQTAFSGISGTIGAVRRSIEVMSERVHNLRRLIERSPVSAEANAAFVGPFLSFSKRFLVKISDFETALQRYLTAREQEARAQTVYRIAQDARERLRQRLTTSDLAQTDGAVESRIKGELTTSVNYAEAETNMQTAVRQARVAETDVQARLSDIHALCQAAAEPAKRDRDIAIKPADDLYTRFVDLPVGDAGIARIKGPINELLMLYQRAYGMFQLDFDRLKLALARLDDNSGAYFHAKAEDHDITAKREKLRKIEVLIQFLERAAQLSTVKEFEVYVKFSKALSEVIAEPYASWKFASEELLPAKVRAEAEVSARF